MGKNPDVFECMIQEAMEEVANHGWKQAAQNAVTLASIGMMVRRTEKKIDRIVKPAWVIAGSLGSAIIWWVISSILGL